MTIRRAEDPLRPWGTTFFRQVLSREDLDEMRANPQEEYVLINDQSEDGLWSESDLRVLYMGAQREGGFRVQSTKAALKRYRVHVSYDPDYYAERDRKRAERQNA